MLKDKKTQWHPAFCCAVQLELKEDAQYLEYTSEYVLNTKPLQIDLLVIKKKSDIELKNEIGKIFRKYNICEYKSPDDSMNSNTFLKVLSYAYLYKTQEKYVDEIALDEITITMVREQKPQKLFKWFSSNGYIIRQKYAGIYYIEKEYHFLVQVIVSSELSKENQKWLTLLSRSLEREDAERALKQLYDLSEAEQEKLGSAVLLVAEDENRELFEVVKEDENMCEFIRKFMAPEIAEAREEAKQEGRAEGRAEGIKDIIMNSLRAGNSATDISRIMQIPIKEVEIIANEN